MSITATSCHQGKAHTKKLTHCDADLGVAPGMPAFATHRVFYRAFFLKTV